MIITLTRDSQQATDYCTFGVLEINGRGKFPTVELPWVPFSNEPCGEQGKSCIGKGLYRVEPRETEARGKHWILSNPALQVYRMPGDVPAGVYARTLVLIHAANWAHELLGCIAPGKERARTDGEWGVTQSRSAMNEIRTLVGNTYDLQLEIR